MKENNLIKKIFFIILCFVIIFLSIMVSSSDKIISQNFNSNILDFNEGWKTNEKEVSLENIEVKKNETNIYINKLPEDFKDNCLSFFSINSYVKVYIENKLIYELDKTLKIGKSPGSLANLVLLPDNCSGKEVRIEITSVYDRGTTNFSDVFLGNRAELIIKLFKSNLISIITNIAIFAIGMVLIFLFMIFKNKLLKVDNIFYLSIFAITFSLWSLLETHFTHIFFNNATLKYYLCYFCLYMFPLAFLLYIKSEGAMGKIYNKISLITICIHFIWYYLAFFGHLIGFFDLTETLFVYHILLGFEIFLFAIFLANFVLKLEFDKDSKKIANIKKLFLGISLILFLFMDIARYYKGKNDAAVYSRIVVLCYVSLVVFVVFQEILKAVMLSKKAKEYKNIAYYDSLTKIGSRTAFNYRKEKFENSNCYIIYMDLNYLKKYNDNYGHEMGDRLLISCANIISNSFGIDNSYRIGGDEFCVLLKDISEKEFNEKLEKYYNSVEEFNNSNDVLQLVIALGYCSKNENEDFQECFRIADKRMYKNKEELKKNYELNFNK